MIFKSIKLVNFRQYKDTHEYTFSNPDKSRITLFIAENGVGKTTFIQAFRFCFYGSLQNNKYLNLPKADDLLNNQIVKKINDGDKATLSVEISFRHNGKDYFMKREIEYIKENNKMIKLSEEPTLGERIEGIGYKSVKNELANIEMAQILPPGLSHIFMFDGERMERSVSSREFREDLKESILGILNIKQYDSLIDYLGTDRKASTVIGKLHKKITHSSLEETEARKIYDKLLDNVEGGETTLHRIKEEIEELEKEIEHIKIYQKEMDLDKDRVNELEKLNLEINILRDQEYSKSREMSQKAMKALLSKELMKFKDTFDKFVNKTVDDEEFYQYLHEETLRQILNRKRCICGTSVMPDSITEKAINKMFKNALPMANAQYLSYIRSDIFGKVNNYSEQIIDIKKIRSDINLIKAEIQKKISEAETLIDRIIETEKQHSHSSQEDSEELKNRREVLLINKKACELEIESNTRLLSIQENKLKPMWEKNESNKVILRTIESLNRITSELTLLRDEKDAEARMILSTHFNNEIKVVMSGNYETKIDPDYSIHIFDKDKQVDVTEILSTGQSVIISVSFIKSLILTAQELSEEYSSDSKYGVVMDAALSNLDENHISKISSSNLTQLDQLIFLSFRRQLRDEMYSSIKDHIGIAYVLTLSDKGIDSELILRENLDEYIHRMVGMEYEGN